MNLHEDGEMFTQLIEAAADYMGLADTGIIEKDYFVTFFLQKIIEKLPNIIFKGGTSLSKCYKIINRFSEDIDLNVDAGAKKLTEGQRRRLKQDIVSIIADTGLSLENAEQIRSRRDFNRYVIRYKSSGLYGSFNQYLIVETSVSIKSFPTETLNAASFIYDFLLANNAETEIEKYGLEPFKVLVQSINRTFIDKVFAIADYYLDGHIENHSRHIYDLYKLYPQISFNSGFQELVKEVREIRKPHIVCHSAKDGVDLPELLRKIINDDVYRSDYNRITAALLFDKVQYSEAVTVLRRIMDDRFFEAN